MEYYKGNTLLNIMYGDKEGKQHWHSTRLAVTDHWAESFHVWAMDWNKNNITLSLDGIEMTTLQVKYLPLKFTQIKGCIV